MRPNLALRIYADSRPHNLKISSLQKGLILVHNGEELVEEGIGFGVPVAVFKDKTFFSSSARVSIGKDDHGEIIEKVFLLDTSPRRRWKITPLVDNPFYTVVSSFFEKTYTNYPDSRKFMLPLMELKNRVGVKTNFVRSISKGFVMIRYRIIHGQLDIEADLTGLSVDGLKKLVFLNEQGSTFFKRLVKSDGQDLIDRQIGAWNLINCSQVSFSDLNNSLSFSLRKLPKSQLFIGREYFKGLTAWAGIEYEVEPHLNRFNYSIQFR